MQKTRCIFTGALRGLISLNRSLFLAVIRPSNIHKNHVMSNQFHTLTVQSITPETPDAVTVAFTIPDSLQDTFSYKQGQYLTLRFTINGEDVRRAYSMCSSPLDKEIAVTVKQVEGGVVSTHINRSLQAGDTVDVMPPEGRFYTKLDPDQRKDYYLIGAGSGITPLMSILRTVLEKEPMSRIILLYGNRNEDSIIFKDQLDEFVQKYDGQLVVRHILSQPKREKSKGIGGLFSKGKISWEGPVGRISPVVIGELLEDFPVKAPRAEFFICGPGNLIDISEKALKERGINGKNVHSERFTAGTKGAEAKQVSGTAGAKVHVHLDGQNIEIAVPPNKTILDVLLAQKYDPPYSCTSGACSSCMAKVIKGSVRMETCFALDEEEVEEGYILTCQSHPTTDEVEITYEV